PQPQAVTNQAMEPLKLLVSWPPPTVTADIDRYFMKRVFIILMAGVVAGPPSMFASEQSLLARITVYWPSGGGVERASSNGIQLKNGHCAVDPSKIPYGSQVVFPDA